MIVFRDSQHLTHDDAVTSARQIVTGKWWINYEPGNKRRFVVYSNASVPEWRKRTAHTKLSSLSHIVASSDTEGAS